MWIWLDSVVCRVVAMINLLAVLLIGYQGHVRLETKRQGQRRQRAKRLP